MNEELTAKFGAANARIQMLESGQTTDQELLRDLGMTRQKKQRDRRLEAMTKPEDFDAARQAAYVTLQDQVVGTYKAQFEQYQAAGFDSATSKSKAMKIAKATQQSLEEAIESEFGSDARSISAAKKITQAAADQTGIKF